MASGTMVELVAARGQINTSDQIQLFEAFQKVFVVNGANLYVADFTNTKLTHTQLGTPHANGDLLTQNQGGGKYAYMVVDYTDSTKTHTYGFAFYSGGATAFNTTNTVNGSGSGSSFTPTAVTDKPHWYKWTVYTGDENNYGKMPEKAYLGCLYRGRCVLSGNPIYPHQWYMSRIANPWDWNYSATDAMTAVAGQQANAGQIGDVIRALIPYKDDILIFGCATSMWYLRGDPASGGTIDSFDLTVGIYGADSWCIDSKGTLYFWGSGGIYACGIEGGMITKPELITGLLLPNIVRDENVSPSTHKIIMGYDRKRLGILICITRLADGVNSNYWYDLRTQGFFPETYPISSSAYSIFNYQANEEEYSDLLIGCQDGFVRKFNDSLKADNVISDEPGTGNRPINSYVGMVQALGDTEDKAGRVNSITITTAGGATGGAFADTDSVNYELRRANNAEEAWEDLIDNSQPQETGTISTVGRQYRIRKRLKGGYFSLKFYNETAGKTWAIEKVTADVQPAGRIK